MGLGTAQQTIATGANFIPELWGPPVIVATEDALVMRDLCWDWSDPFKGKGDTIHVPNISNLSSNSKAANTQVTLNAPTEGKVDMVITAQDECSFLIEDILKVQSAFNLMSYYTKKAGFAIGKTIDSRAIALVSGFSQVQGAAGIDLGDQQIRDAIEMLDLANADGQKNLVIHPTQKNALFAIEKYFRADIQGTGASQVLTKGKFGGIYDVNVYVSTNVGTSGGAYLNTLFTKEAIAIANQMGPRTQGDYIIEYLGNIVVTDMISSEVKARDSFGVWMKS